MNLQTRCHAQRGHGDPCHIAKWLRRCGLEEGLVETGVLLQVRYCSFYISGGRADILAARGDVEVRLLLRLLVQKTDFLRVGRGLRSHKTLIGLRLTVVLLERSKQDPRHPERSRRVFFLAGVDERNPEGVWHSDQPFVSPKACLPLLELDKAGGGPSDNEWRRAESERDQQAQGSLLHFASLSAGFVRKKRLLRSDGDGRACGSATKETLITLSAASVLYERRRRVSLAASRHDLTHYQSFEIARLMNISRT